MLLARTVFNKPTVAHSPVETIEPPTREVKTIDVASRLSEKGGGGDPEPEEDDDPPPETTDLGDPPEPDEPEPEEPVAPAPEYWREYGAQDEPSFKQQMAQWRQQAAQAEQYRQHAAVLWQMNQQALQRQQAPAPAQPKLPWNIPTGYSPDMESLLTVNESGEIVSRPGVDPTLPQKRREYMAARDQAISQFLSDPGAIVQNVMGDYVKQQAMQIAQSQIHEYHRQNALRTFESQNLEWLYDAPGVLSPAGNLWNQHYVSALQSGLPDPIGYATNAVDAAAFREDLNSRAAAEAQGITPDANAQKKRALLTDSAGRKPNRSGSFRKPGKEKGAPPQNRTRLWSDLRKKLDAMPREEVDAV